VREDRGEAVGERSREPVVDLLGGDELAFRRRPAEERARRERLPVGEPLRREGPEDALARIEDAVVRVPKRSWLESGAGRARYRSSSFFRMPRKATNRRQ
jgi:hypothetical protein